MTSRPVIFRLCVLSLFGTLVCAAKTGAADSWVPTATTGAPAARYDHVAVWTGTHLIVWGGTGTDGAPLGDGGIYDPVAKSWKSVSRLGAPSPRTLATAVWTGNLLIVWGGVAFTPSSVTLGDGAAYDPATDTWTPISRVLAPSPRVFHTAVWTGTEMVVWGGFADLVIPGPPPTALVTGAVYDPSTDTWRPTATAHAPPARGGHVAVWTGERMIVWGGSTGHAAIGGGGIYDPETDVWTPTSTAGQPSGRVAHTGIWDGARFLVWGGLLDDGSETNTGGSFDPVENAWAAIPLAGAASARDSQAGAALGGRLIVWSGENGFAKFTNTGGIFDPRTGTWAATALSGAPGARENASVVSTGRSLIFWGGLAENPLATGGEYFPPFCVDGRRGCILNVPGGRPPAVVEGRP